ncbi:MAG: histidine--tRNA ligase [Candidatus Sumerlaeaceae bacterium]|nr:histidine--tRNA ligase [Candidatus Sumerlaeaceae bacterium]
MGKQTIQSIRGMEDVLPDEAVYFQFLEAAARRVFGRAQYREIRTPLLEPTELFARSAGDSSDIVVSKQMYTFVDPGERSNTLRPEGTAGVIRALIEHGVFKESAQQKLYYTGPMFRYEKPQKGRLRQFNQIGIEVFGVAHAAADAEIIVLCVEFLREVGFRDVCVKLNNLGDREDRQAYNNRLREVLAGGASDGWCPQCVERARLNPMRVFDCKEQRCRALVAGLPAVGDFIGEPARAHFATLRSLLEACEVPYEIAPDLVRGLDYYSRTVFEIVQGGLGAQNAVVGGGRYDYLVEELGGPPTPGVGMSIGVERLILAMKALDLRPPGEPPPAAMVLALDDAAMPSAFRLASAARVSGAPVALDLQPRSPKAGLKAANRLGVRVAVIIGADEAARGVAQWKDLSEGTQTEVRVEEALERLKALSDPSVTCR